MGIDVESHAAVSASALADVALAGRELTAHRRRRRSARTPALARTWVSAEAVLKATGTGLRADPADLVIRSRGRLTGFPRTALSRTALTRTALTPDGRRALLADLDLGPHLAGAVAVVPDASISTGRPAPHRPGRPSRLSVRQHAGDAVLTDLSRR